MFVNYFSIIRKYFWCILSIPKGMIGGKVMNALAMIGEFFSFFVELFMSIINGFTGLFAEDDSAEA